MEQRETIVRRKTPQKLYQRSKNTAERHVRRYWRRLAGRRKPEHCSIKFINFLPEPKSDLICLLDLFPPSRGTARPGFSINYVNRVSRGHVIAHQFLHQLIPTDFLSPKMPSPWLSLLTQAIDLQEGRTWNVYVCWISLNISNAFLPETWSEACLTFASELWRAQLSGAKKSRKLLERQKCTLHISPIRKSVQESTCEFRSVLLAFILLSKHSISVFNLHPSHASLLFKKRKKRCSLAQFGVEEMKNINSKARKGTTNIRLVFQQND